MNLCLLLQAEREAIISEWIDLLSRTTTERYRQREVVELRQTVARAFDGNYSVICNHDWQPIEEFIVFITRMRLERGFSLSEVQRAFGLFRVIMLRRLPLVFQGEELVSALLAVNHSVDVTINRFSEYFQSKHEEAMQGFLENLEGKVKERTEQLYNSEKRYRTLVEGISDGYFVCREGRLIFANSAFGRMLGRRPEKLTGLVSADLFSGGLESAALDSEPEAVTSEAIRADGSSFPVEIKLDRIQYDGRPALAGVCRDIGERVASARRELEHERLVVIGRVATVFAHEIRNSLSSIKVNVRVLQRRLDLQENDRRRMEIILRDIDKLDQLLQDTLLFSRPLEISPRPQAPGQLLEEARRRFAERLEAAGVGVEMALGDDLPEVDVDPAGFEIVFDNLLANAIEAMAESGERCLRLAAGRLREPVAGAELVVLEVADSGCGLEEKDLEQIFQPFFTTRKNGIGLGLSNVARVVEQHGGRIEVLSEPGRGALFKVVLPCR